MDRVMQDADIASFIARNASVEPRVRGAAEWLVKEYPRASPKEYLETIRRLLQSLLDQKLSVFFSYKAKDKYIAKKIARWLEEWSAGKLHIEHMARFGVEQVGRDWRLRIEEAIPRCDWFLLLFPSPTYEGDERDWVLFEAGYRLRGEALGGRFVVLHHPDNDVANVLGDEARTPLIISGPATVSTHQYDRFKPLGDQLVRKQTMLCNRLITEVKELLEHYGIPVIPTQQAQTEEEAVLSAQSTGYPVVLKIDSQKVIHKLEHGGVILNIKDEQSVREAFRKLERLAGSLNDPTAKVLIQPMVIRQGYELVIGGKKDPTFGSVIVFGLGGGLLEAAEDYSIGLPPLNQSLTRRMKIETKTCKYLKTKNEFENTLRYLEEILVRFSHLIIHFPHIKEIDINPFFITEKECFVLDANTLLEADMARDIRRGPTLEAGPGNLGRTPEVLTRPRRGCGRESESGNQVSTANDPPS